MDICGLIRRLPVIVAYNNFDDDLFDRLNYSHTVVVLTIFAIVVTNRQFSDNQIKCWVPAQFTGSYEQYVNQICFITNTYSFDMHKSLPEDDDRRHEHELKYYQWTPFILLLMAIFFYIPHECWRVLSLRSGVDLKDLIEAAHSFRSGNLRHDDKTRLLEYLTNWLDGYCANAYRLVTLTEKEDRKSWKSKLLRNLHCHASPFGIYTGNYLIITYILIKFLYLSNSIGQIFLLNTLLGRQFWFYGIDVIYRTWTQQMSFLHSGNDYFPKVVLCDFSIREPNHPKESHRYTVQCVLPFNLFNQQIFTYLYFWLIILSCFNMFSILIWFYRLSPYNNFKYLERRLTLHFLNDDHRHSQQRNIREQFVYRYLRGDGTFMLRLVASNVSDYVCRKIILSLFDCFHDSLKKRTIGREPLFKSISSIRSEDDDDDDNENHHRSIDEKNSNQIKNDSDDDQSTDQTAGSEIPPIPNPRQGKLLIERDTSSKLSSNTDIDHCSEKESPIPTINLPNEKTRSRTSFAQLSKDLAQRSVDQGNHHEEQSSSKYKNLDYYVESDENLSRASSPPNIGSEFCSSKLAPPPSQTEMAQQIGKGPSPYATTYLTNKRSCEHELPYIDESNSSGSNSGRLPATLNVRQTDKKLAELHSRRTHDV